MTRKWVLRSVIGGILGIAVALTAAGYLRSAAPVAGEAEGQAVTESAVVYTLRLEGSVLYVYEGDGSSPKEEYELIPELLPESDRAALEAGVTCTAEELQNRLEDYLG